MYQKTSLYAINKDIYITHAHCENRHYRINVKDIHIRTGHKLYTNIKKIVTDEGDVGALIQSLCMPLLYIAVAELHSTVTHFVVDFYK